MKRYRELLEEVMGNTVSSSVRGEEILKKVRDYYSDGRYYEERGMKEEALSIYAYAFGLLEGGIMSGTLIYRGSLTWLRAEHPEEEGEDGTPG